MGIPALPLAPAEYNRAYHDQLNRILSLYLSRAFTEVTTDKEGTWDGTHLVMGVYHLWIDATGDLRIKSSAPTTDLDGTVVGTQT